ncbi:MAG: hypothetical protein C0502_04765 [Opitutus sp.]|nr:hypothetical protein [Opitutus sp.]
MRPPSSSTADPVLQLIDKKPLWKVSPANGSYYINSVAVSADGSRVVAGTFYHVYGAGESRRSPPGATPPPVATPSSSDNGTFGTYGYDQTGRLLWKDEFQGWQGVYWVAVSADGSRAAAGGLMAETGPQGFVRAYDAANRGRMLLSHPTKKRVNQVSLSADGAWLVSAAETLLLFRAGLPYYQQTAEFTSPGNESIVSASISQDGGTVAYADYAGWIGVLANDNGALTPRARWKVPGAGKSDFCHMISLAPDGRTFVAGGSGGQFFFFDVAKFIATGGPTVTYGTGVKEAVYGVAGSADGSLFAGVVNDGEAGKAYVARIVDGEAPAVPALSLKRNPNCAAINVSGGMIRVVFADGHPDGTPGHFYLYSCPTGAGQPLLRLRWIYPTGNMSWPIAFSASGNAVVGGSDDSHLYYFTP